MELKKILKGIENYKSKGDMDIDILSIEDNSKNVKPGSLFVAVKGFDFDGHKFIEEAIENGASAIMIDINSDVKNCGSYPLLTLYIIYSTIKSSTVRLCSKLTILSLLLVSYIL